MFNQPMWRCVNCGKETPQNKMLVDSNVVNSPVVQYGCPHCRDMNCMERVDG